MPEGTEGGAPFMTHDGRFVASQDTPRNASVILFGAPFDGTTSFVPGTRFGPRRIREASVGIETYSPALDRDLEEIRFFDHGDLELPFGNTGLALERIEAFMHGIFDGGKSPFMLGGEHLVTFPAVRAAKAAYPDLVVIQFDAHTDLREEYMGEADSHATVMRRIVDYLGGDRVYQVGLRSGTREEFLFGRRTTHFYPGAYDPKCIERIVQAVKGHPVYITVDIDVVDPAFAPGTGTPEAGGWTPNELFAAVHAFEGVDVVACDVVEVCPLAEHGAVTSLLAAKLVREMLLTFAGSM